MKSSRLLFVSVLLWTAVWSLSAQSADTPSGRTPIYHCDVTHKYEHTMFLTCQLFEGQQPISDFEIAVFDRQGKCRGQTLSGNDEHYPDIAYLTIRGTSGQDTAMTVRVVYGDDTDPYKYNRVVKDLPIHMLNNHSIGHTATPYRIQLPTGPKYTWCRADGMRETGDIASLSPQLLQGATTLDIDGTWTAAQWQLLQQSLPRATLQQVSFADDCLQQSFARLLAHCPCLTQVRFERLPTTEAPDCFEASNPNAIITLPQGATVPRGWTNVVSRSQGHYVALTDMAFVGSTADDPHPFALDLDIHLQGHTATYTPGPLTYFQGRGGWNTLVLPFDAAVYADEQLLTPFRDAQLYPHGYWLMRFAAGNTQKIAFNYESSGIKAHVPYLLALPGDAVGPEWSVQPSVITFRATGDLIKAVPTPIHDAPLTSPVLFCGTYQPLKEKPLYILSRTSKGGNAFTYRSQANVLPFQAYITLRDEAGISTPSFPISNDYLPTHIVLPQQLEDTNAQHIIDLSGRSLRHIEDATHGIYLINGKKRWIP